jgi:hypothetical protein
MMEAFLPSQRQAFCTPATAAVDAAQRAVPAACVRIFQVAQSA